MTPRTPIGRRVAGWARGRRWRTGSARAALLGCTVLIAGCGAGGGGTGTGTTNNQAAYSAALKFSNCMRSHGVPNFPDPGAGGGGIQITAKSGINPGSPAFQSARSACRRYRPGLGGPPHPLSAAQRQQLLAFSQCMRTHGVPNFPDPVFPASGGAMIGGPSPSFTPGSPAFRRAAAACGGPFGGGPSAVKRAGG